MLFTIRTIMIAALVSLSSNFSLAMADEPIGIKLNKDNDDKFFMETFGSKSINLNMNLLVVAFGTEIHLVDATTKKRSAKWTSPWPVTYPNFSPSGNLIVTTETNGVDIWTIKGKLLWRIPAGDEQIHLATFGNNDATVIVNYINDTSDNTHYFKEWKLPLK